MPSAYTTHNGQQGYGSGQLWACSSTSRFGFVNPGTPTTDYSGGRWPIQGERGAFVLSMPIAKTPVGVLSYGG
jgi:hypothetical protein